MGFNFDKTYKSKTEVAFKIKFWKILRIKEKYEKMKRNLS